MTRASPPHKIISVWHIYSDFHSVSRRISMTFLPTRTPLPTLASGHSVGSGRMEKKFRFHRKFVESWPDSDFRNHFLWKCFRKKIQVLSSFWKKKDANEQLGTLFLKRDRRLLHLRMSNFRRLVLHDYSLISWEILCAGPHRSTLWNDDSDLPDPRGIPRVICQIRDASKCGSGYDLYGFIRKHFSSGM